MNNICQICYIYLLCSKHEGIEYIKCIISISCICILVITYMSKYINIKLTSPRLISDNIQLRLGRFQLSSICAFGFPYNFKTLNSEIFNVPLGLNLFL